MQTAAPLDSLRESSAEQPVSVVDLDRLTFIEATVSNLTDWGCRLTSPEIAHLHRSIGIHFAGSAKMTRGTITSIRGTAATVVFPKAREAVQNKRRERRYTVSIPARLADPATETTVDCRITDAGRSGCRIEGRGIDALPDSVRLYIRGLGAPVQGQIVWRHDGMAGVRLDWDFAASPQG